MSQNAIEFDRFRLTIERRKLVEHDIPVRIGGRALDILIALAEAGGEIVSNREILERVWPDMSVDQAALRVQVSNLRNILGRTADGEPFILNVQGRGYKLVGDIRRVALVEPERRQSFRAVPIVANRLIGRADLLDSLCENLSQRQVLTLVGPPGVGKTTLALAVAARLASTYETVAFADLGMISAPALVGRSVALALGLATELADPMPAISSLLRSGRNLIVLDNCEHLIEAAAGFVEALCAEAPGVDILATSREPLRSRGEWVNRLPPLRYPSSEPMRTVAEALKYPAVELFVERASACTSDFEFVDEGAAYVGEICRQLEGVPLALELAAGWSDVFTLKTLAERLDGHLMLRAKGRRNAPARHRTLRAAIDWSHDLLSENERRVFRRLSVFVGAFSAEAARAVAPGPGAVTAEVAETIAELARKSLVAVSMRDEPAVYHLLMAPRAYAAERLEEAGETYEVRRLHLAWVLDQLRRAEEAWGLAERSEWLRRNMTLVDEVRAAAAWAESPSCDLELALALSFDSAPLWFRYSLTSEGRALAEALQRRFAAEGAIGLGEDLKLRVALGVPLMFTRAPNAEVTQNWRRVLELAKDAGDLECQMLAHWGLWHTAWLRGDIRARYQHALAAMDVAKRSGDPVDLASAERMLTAAWFSLGALDAARGAAERMLRPAAPLRPKGVARFQFDTTSSALSLLAQIHWLQGRYDETLTAANEAVEVAERSGHGLTLSLALLILAHLGALLGDPHVALAALDRHVAMPESQGLQATEAADAIRAIALADQGRLEEAVVILARAFADPTTTRLAGRFPILVGRWADILGEGGRADLALALVRDSRARFVQEDENVMLPDLVRAEAVLLARTGHYPDPTGLLLEAKAAAERQGTLTWALRASLDLVRFGPPGGAASALADLHDAYLRLGAGASADRRRAADLIERDHPARRVSADPVRVKSNA